MEQKSPTWPFLLIGLVTQTPANGGELTHKKSWRKAKKDSSCLVTLREIPHPTIHQNQGTAV